MTEASARVIADSITETGNRLITFEATCWRPVLAEQNTHCVLSRNSASSRAIPVGKQLDRFKEDFAAPIVWPREQKGMQGGSDLEGQDLDDAQALWARTAAYIHATVSDYVEQHPDAESRLHKSMLNRLLEFGLWQKQAISATQWKGYFWQRTHKDAEPHIQAMAKAMYFAAEESTPKLLLPGEWHLPYWGENSGHDTDWDDAANLAPTPSEDVDSDGWAMFDDAVVEIAKQCSVARCGRTSYMTQDGIRDLTEDISLYERLTSNRVGSEDPPHASPLEHIATPWADNIQHVTLPNGTTMGPLPKLGKFVGWLQLRHEVLGF